MSPIRDTRRQPRLPYAARCATRVRTMPTPSNVHRSRHREAQVNLRFSTEEREELRRRANEAGMTVQTYADWKLLGRDPNVKVGGRRVGQRPLEDLEGLSA